MIALVWVTACSSTPDATPTSSTPDATTTATPSTTVTPTTTTEMPATSSTTTSSTSTSTTEPPGEDDRWLQDEFPEFDMTVDDPTEITEFERLVEEYLVARSWLLGHPMDDVTTLGQHLRSVFCPDSPAYESAIKSNDTRLANRRKTIAAPSVYEAVSFGPFGDGTDGVARVVYLEAVVGLVQFVDLDTAEVVQEFDSQGELTSFEIEFRAGDGARWCVWQTGA